MIDTIKIGYPMNGTLYRLLQDRAERLQKISPDGDILWERSVVRGDCMPSHYSGLRITTRTQRDLLEMGLPSDFLDTSRDMAFFEFSLQKWQSPAAYNNNNSSIENDVEALKAWIRQLSIALDYVFSFDLFELYRVDISENFLLTSCNPTAFIRSLELHLSRHSTSDSRLERYGHMVALRSSWLGKKLYYKYQEFMDVERKKRASVYTPAYIAGESSFALDSDFVPLSHDEICNLTRMVRFELEFKRAYLKRYAMGKLIHLYHLVPRFKLEVDSFLTVPVIESNILDSLSAQQRSLISYVQDNGYVVGRDKYISKYSKTSFYRIKQSLLAYSINLDALENINVRSSLAELAAKSEKIDFQLVLAPSYEPYLKAA